MRVNCVSDETIKMMKDSGCVRCIFGMETGSEKMLKIMNKGVKLSDNYKALDYVHKYDMTTTPQLVLGMPGETNETVKEILGIGDTLCGHILIIDALKLSFRKVKLNKRSDCYCNEKKG